jgi:hypothetical protein
MFEENNGNESTEKILNNLLRDFIYFNHAVSLRILKCSVVGASESIEVFTASMFFNN